MERVVNCITYCIKRLTLEGWYVKEVIAEFTVGVDHRVTIGDCE